MNCPFCKNPLREKNAGSMTLDICYGGCGGIWFDAVELERISTSAPAATTLHSIWHLPTSNGQPTGPRCCPRCPDLTLDRKWFSDLKKVEIDQCSQCGGIWLDAGEFSHIYDEMKSAREASPLWARALSEAVTLVNDRPAATEQRQNA